MQQFDLLEIRKNIEEIRLVYALKIEKFLSVKLNASLSFLKRIFAAKNTAFFGSLIIVAISILARSTRDTGHDSATYFEIVEKMLSGGKYFYDFFEFNLPLAFLFTAAPYSFAKFFSLNMFAVAEVFINLLAILSLYFSSRILARSELSKDRIAFNLVILSFASGFFLRVFDLQFNEFLTKSSYFLIFVFPYFSYHLIDESRLKNFDQIAIGILAAILFALKPHYGVLVIVFELEKILKSKSIKKSFCLRNYITLLSLLGYLLFLWERFPNYIIKLPEIISAYYIDDSQAIFLILKEDVFPLLLPSLICFSLVKKDKILQRFFILLVAAMLMVLLEKIGGFDQRFVIHSLALPLLSLLFLAIFRNDMIDWKKDWFFLLLILLIPQFDAKTSFDILLNTPLFWWIMVLILSKKWQKILPEKNQKNEGKITRFFLLQDVSSWLCFLAIACYTNWLSISGITSLFGWVISAIILNVLIFFYQKKHEEIFFTSRFTTLSACALFVVISYVLAFHISAIFNFEFCKECQRYKSPNHLNSEIIRISKTYSDKDEDVIIISEIIPGTYPQFTYAEKKNHLPFLNYFLLFRKISDHKNQVSDIYKYQLSALKEGLKNKNTKLVFIEKKNYLYSQTCSIGFLEFYFRDKEFKKIFLKDYVFLNRIIERKTVQADVKFLKEEHNAELPKETKIIDRDVEVYIRKQS